MDTELIKTFAGVARAGSFAAFARERGVDASSVSRNVAHLEEALGFILFERTTRRLSLTEAGQLYLSQALPLVDALTDVGDMARDQVTELSGLLRITTSVAFGERWLMPRVAAFRARFPKVDVALKLTDAVVDLRAEGVDLALRLAPKIRGSVVAVKLFDTPYRLVAAPAYLKSSGTPASPAAIAEQDGVLFEIPRFRQAWSFLDKETGTQVRALPRPALTASNALAIRRACIDGLGLALLADWTIADDLKSGVLVDVFPDHCVSVSGEANAAWIVYPSQAYVTARMRSFIDLVRASAVDGL